MRCAVHFSARRSSAPGLPGRVRKPESPAAIKLARREFTSPSHTDASLDSRRYSMSIRFLSVIFAFAAIAAAQTFHPYSIFATGTAVSATGPDSITVGNGSVWVSYTNGADSTGASGSSTIVQYSLGSKVRHTYSIAGSVDGLKIEPRTGLVWALQNQDGNSALTLIDPLHGTTS